MPVHSGRSLLSFALLSFLLAVPAPTHAGVRVLEPQVVSASSPSLPRRSNLQLGAGPANALSRDIAGPGSGWGWNATGAFEGVASPEWSWVARCEYTRFEKSGSLAVAGPGDFLPFVGPALQQSRTTITTLEIGARYSPHSGVLHPYAELAAGVGRHETLEKITLQNSPSFAGDTPIRKYRATVDVAVGGAWQPPQFPLGIFFEGRALSEPGRDGALWFAPRLGLLALLPPGR